MRANHHVELVQILEGLVMLLGQFVQASWYYEPGHQSHPWNEFVDVAKKAECLLPIVDLIPVSHYE